MFRRCKRPECAFSDAPLENTWTSDSFEFQIFFSSIEILMHRFRKKIDSRDLPKRPWISVGTWQRIFESIIYSSRLITFISSVINGDNCSSANHDFVYIAGNEIHESCKWCNLPSFSFCNQTNPPNRRVNPLFVGSHDFGEKRGKARFFLPSWTEHFALDVHYVNGSH